MITKMTRYDFIMLSQQSEAFIQDVAALGLVDITRSSKPVDEQSIQWMAEADRLKERIQLLKNKRFEKDSEYASLLEQVKAAQKCYDNGLPWGDFDKEKLTQVLGKELLFCLCEKKKFNESWALAVCQDDGKNVWFVALAEDLEGDAKSQIKCLPAPEYGLAVAQDKLKSAQQALAEREAALMAEDICALEKEYRSKLQNLDRYLAGVAAENAVENYVTVFTGFAPTEQKEAITAALNEMDIFYLSAEADVEDNPPIHLKNNAFVKQFEPLTEMYGVPVYNEFDPTVFLSIFFLLFFAMCMGDAGYGIVLILAGLFMKGKEGGLAKMYRLIITLGVGTFVVGLLMGGFFGINLAEQTWVPDALKRYMLVGEVTVMGRPFAIQMLVALGIGVFHLCLAFIMKAVYAIKKAGFKHSLSTLGWTLLIVGSVLAFAAGMIFNLSEEVIKWSIISIAAVSALGIYIFNKWGRNPLVNIGSGLWDTYSMASGLMGDVLSYIRLYALGLSGGMLGATFNQLAGMVKDCGIPGLDWGGFILIALFGHVLNIAMSCLGAFVHPLRLNFVEFFKNSDYEGRGNKYNPLKK